MKKNGIFGFLIITLIIFLLSVEFVFAITGSIGNSRMILRDVKAGSTIERTLLVLNKNEVPIDIKLEASGDLAGDIEIIDNEFRLEPQEEKKARFKIKVKEVGESESNINVFFTPIDGKNGVGLSSTIIVLATKDGVSSEELEEEIPEEENANEEENQNDNNFGVSVSTGNANNIEGKILENSFKLNVMTIGIGITVLMFVVLVVLVIIYTRKAKRGLIIEKSEVVKPKKSIKKK